MVKVIIETDDSGCEIRGDLAIAVMLSNGGERTKVESAIGGNLIIDDLNLFGNILPHIVSDMVRHVAKETDASRYAYKTFLTGLRMLEDE